MEKLADVELRRVAVALDGSNGARAAFQLALALHENPRPNLFLLAVVPTLPAFAQHPEEAKPLLDRLRQDARDVLAAAAAQAASFRVDRIQLEGQPAEEVCRSLERVLPDLVLVGCRGLSGRRAHRIGTVGEAIARESQVPVLVARGHQRPRRLLVAVDGSPGSRRAAIWAGGLARDIGAAVTLFYVIPQDSEDVRFTVTRSVAEPFLGPIAALLERAGVQVARKVAYGHPAHEVVAEARRGDHDTIVVGRWGRSAPEGFVMGGVADRVLHSAACNVLVVP